ncbi:MAG TPA: helix-turn-helix domain-containing protein [Ktedonobacteraceae bacterium]
MASNVEELKRLGFTGAEAQVYVFLLQYPHATGYEVSKGTGLPRANAYQALETLVAKEHIAAVSQEPVRYAAVPPALLFRRIQEETRQRCSHLEQELSTLGKPETVGHFWELRERERIEQRLIELIQSARHRIAASLWAEDLDGLAEPLRAARARGCTIILNLFGEARVDFATIYRHEGSEKVVGGHVVALAVDFSEALVASFDAPATGVITQNRTLVWLVEKLIRDESYLASIYERFSSELEGAFGRHLVDLRRRLLPETDAARLFTMTTMDSETVCLPSSLE